MTNDSNKIPEKIQNTYNQTLITNNSSFNNLTNSLFESMQTQQLLHDYQVMLTTNLNISFLSQNSLKYIMMHLQAKAGAILLEKNGELYVASSKRIANPSLLQTHEGILEVYNSGKQITMMKPEDIKDLIDFMKHDKKIKDGKHNFSLLRKLGKAVHDIEVDEETIKESILFYIENKNCED